MAKKKPQKKVRKKVVSKKKPVRRVRGKESNKQELKITIVPQTTTSIPTEEELSKPINSEGKSLTLPKTWVAQDQLMFMLQSTPKNQIYKRPGKGGKSFEYVTGSYITKALNYVFGWNWDFEVKEHGIEKGHIWVLGKLTVRGNKPGQEISKTQFGRAEVKYLTTYVNKKKVVTGEYVDFGNDLKAATTDALKKCASMLGFASDVYGKMEYKTEAGRDPSPSYTPQQQQTIVPTKPVLQKGQVLDMDGNPVWLCQNCDDPINEQTANYSMKMYKKRLCSNCQQR